MKKRMFFTMLTVFGLTIVSIELAYEQFLFISNRGIVNQTIDDILAFYGYINFTWETVVWYSFSLLIAWLGINKAKFWSGGIAKWVKITGMMAFCFAPTVFVNPSQAINVATLLAAVNFTTPSLLLPFWVSFLRYSIEAPYLWYRLVAYLTIAWVGLLMWFMLLGLSLVISPFKDYLWANCNNK